MNEDGSEAPASAGLTALVTIDLGRRHRQLVERVDTQAFHLATAGIAVVVAHNDRGGHWDQRLKDMAVRWPSSSRLVSHALDSGIPNNSMLRNFGARHILTTHMALLDADIFPDTGLLREMYDSVSSGAEPFAMAPCLYLTVSGSRYVQSGKPIAEIYKRYLRFDKSQFHHLASPSSVMIFSVADFAAIGGFCEDYRGHGYEDFDFMIRLALAKKAIKTSAEFLVDRPYHAPLLADGFRAVLSILCLNRMLDRKFALHLHHDKQARDPYYMERVSNADLFKRRMESLLIEQPPEAAQRSARSILSDAFFDNCEKRGIDSAHYYVLFDARPDFMSRPVGLIRRIRRFLRTVGKAFRKNTGREAI